MQKFKWIMAKIIENWNILSFYEDVKTDEE